MATLTNPLVQSHVRPPDGQLSGAAPKPPSSPAHSQVMTLSNDSIAEVRLPDAPYRIVMQCRNTSSAKSKNPKQLIRKQQQPTPIPKEEVTR